MARSKTRNGPVQRRWNAPCPSTRPPPLPPTQAARDARLRRQILAGTCNPKRPPTPCTLNPVDAARVSSDWAPVLDAYLWAHSADTWEVWHAHVQTMYPLEFWGSPRDSLTAAVEKFHAARNGWMSCTYSQHERPVAGSASATLWWLGCGLDPSVRDTLARVYREDQHRRQRAPDPEEAEREAFLVDAFTGAHETTHARVVRFLNTVTRTADGTLLVTEPEPPAPADPTLSLRAVAKLLGVHFPPTSDEP